MQEREEQVAARETGRISPMWETDLNYLNSSLSVFPNLRKLNAIKCLQQNS